MAVIDELLSILDAILAKLTTESGAGGAIPWLNSFVALRNPQDLPENFALNLPLLLVYPSAAIPIDLDSLPDCRERKEYTIRFSLLESILQRDNYYYQFRNGKNYCTEIATHLDAIEQLFRRDRFGIAWQALSIRDSYNDIPLPQSYEGQRVEQGHLDMKYFVRLTYG